MLRMMVATHGLETCPASVPEVRDKVLPELQKLDEVAKKLGVAVQGGWTNMPAHAIYIVVDAPNAHVTNQMADGTAPHGLEYGDRAAGHHAAGGDRNRAATLTASYLY